jgi:hypothetical protein
VVSKTERLALSDLLLFAPHRREDAAAGELPTHVRAPHCDVLSLFVEDFAMEVGRRYGAPVQMMQLDHGIFDEASISVIAAIAVTMRDLRCQPRSGLASSVPRSIKPANARTL